MIFDNISNIKSYENLGERWKKAFAFLKQYKGGDNGKIVIDGENLFAIVQNAENTREVDNLKWESHNKYADIQYILDGEERFGIASVDNLSAITDYDENNDIRFYKGANENFITIKAGDVLILFPQDAHLPLCHSLKGISVNKRVVVKVRL